MCGQGLLGCVAKRHLRWKTLSENHSDKVTHGTHNRGSRHYGAKLSERDVKRIRSGITSSTIGDLAADYGVSPGTIHDVLKRRTWSWLK